MREKKITKIIKRYRREEKETAIQKPIISYQSHAIFIFIRCFFSPSYSAIRDLHFNDGIHAKELYGF